MITIHASGVGVDYKANTYLNCTGDSPWTREDVFGTSGANYKYGRIVVTIAADSDVVPTELQLVDGLGGDSQSFTLYSAGTATNSGNTLCAIYYTRELGGYSDLPGGSSYIHVRAVGLSASDAKAGSCYFIGGLDSSSATACLDKTNTNTGSSETPNTNATGTLSQADEIVIAAIATEGPGSDTAGSWTTGSSNVSGNELGPLGTDSNGAAANQTIRSAAEIVSATTSQTGAMTGITSRDWAAVIASFKIAPQANDVSFPASFSYQTKRLLPFLVR